MEKNFVKSEVYRINLLSKPLNESLQKIVVANPRIKKEDPQTQKN